MITTTLITYALVMNNVNLLGSIEFNTLEDCEVHLDMNMPASQYYETAKCVKIVTVEY